MVPVLDDQSPRNDLGQAGACRVVAVAQETRTGAQNVLRDGRDAQCRAEQHAARGYRQSLQVLRVCLGQTRRRRQHAEARRVTESAAAQRELREREWVPPCHSKDELLFGMARGPPGVTDEFAGLRTGQTSQRDGDRVRCEPGIGRRSLGDDDTHPAPATEPGHLTYGVPARGIEPVEVVHAHENRPWCQREQTQRGGCQLCRCRLGGAACERRVQHRAVRGRHVGEPGQTRPEKAVQCGIPQPPLGRCPGRRQHLHPLARSRRSGEPDDGGLPHARVTAEVKHSPAAGQARQQPGHLLLFMFAADQSEVARVDVRAHAVPLLPSAPSVGSRGDPTWRRVSAGFLSEPCQGCPPPATPLVGAQ